MALIVSPKNLGGPGNCQCQCQRFFCQCLDNQSPLIVNALTIDNPSHHFYWAGIVNTGFWILVKSM